MSLNCVIPPLSKLGNPNILFISINQRKKEAMQCYTNSLNKSPPNSHRVQKCLQKLLRSMHKDRHHTIQHFKHLLETNMDQADREKEITIEHLADIDR